MFPAGHLLAEPVCIHFRLGLRRGPQIVRLCFIHLSAITIVASTLQWKRFGTLIFEDLTANARLPPDPLNLRYDSQSTTGARSTTAAPSLPCKPLSYDVRLLCPI